MGKVEAVAELCEVAVHAVVNHLRHAANVEAHAGCAAGHGLDDGVGQVVAECGHEEHVGGLVEASHFCLVGDVAHADGLDGEGVQQFLASLACQHDDGLLAPLGVLLAEQGECFGEVVDALAGVGDAEGCEEEDALVEWQ